MRIFTKPLNCLKPLLIKAHPDRHEHRTLAYTPYDGSSTPFTIGLQQLDPARWIEPDDDLAFHLSEKRRLFAIHGDQVFRAEPNTEDAQREVLETLADYLHSRYPAIYSRTDTAMAMAGERVDLSGHLQPPLFRAGLMVQDDLVLMRRGEDGWRLVAAFLAFPSSWSLAEKFGRTMDEIHAPVPDFAAGSRNAGLISRMFDNLSHSRFVVRWNWSIDQGYRLYRPGSKAVAEAPPACRRNPTCVSNVRRFARCQALAISCSPSASISTH